MRKILYAWRIKHFQHTAHGYTYGVIYWFPPEQIMDRSEWERVPPMDKEWESK